MKFRHPEKLLGDYLAKSMLFILTCMSAPSGGTRGLPRFMPSVFAIIISCMPATQGGTRGLPVIYLWFDVCRASSEIDFLVGVMYVM